MATTPDIVAVAAIGSWMLPTDSEAVAAPDSEVAVSTDSEAAAAPDLEVAVVSGPGVTATAYLEETMATTPDIAAVAAIGSLLLSTDSEAAAAPDSEVAVVSGPVVTAAAYWEEKVATNPDKAAVAAIGSLMFKLPTDSEAAAAPDSEVAVVSGPVVTAATYLEEKVATNPDIVAVADSGAMTDDAVKKAGEGEWSRDSDWRENLSAMARHGPGDLPFLILFLVVSWRPLLELSAAATLVILSGLVLWFDGTAYNFIRSGVEFRIYPSRLATPQWANRKTFQSVGRPFSRRRKLRVIMAGTGRNLRGNFPWETAAEPSPARSRAKKQPQGGQAAVAESQAAASAAKADKISNMGDQIYASLPESVEAESTAAWEQAAVVSFLDCSHLLCNDSPASQASADECGEDSTVPRTFGCSVTSGATRVSRVGMFGIYQRICETSCHEYSMVPALRALGPGSPARQGARNE